MSAGQVRVSQGSSLSMGSTVWSPSSMSWPMPPISPPTTAAPVALPERISHDAPESRTENGPFQRLCIMPISLPRPQCTIMPLVLQSARLRPLGAPGLPGSPLRTGRSSWRSEGSEDGPSVAELIGVNYEKLTTTMEPYFCSLGAALGYAPASVRRKKNRTLMFKARINE